MTWSAKNSGSDRSGADSMPAPSKCPEATEEKTRHEKKLQIYFRSIEERRAFDSDADKEGMSASRFVVHLYQLFKRGKLKPPTEERQT